MSIKNQLQSLKQVDIAALLCVTVKTIQRWHDEGLPRHGEGVGCHYVWDEVKAWWEARLSRAGAAETDKDRKMRADADLAEMAAEKMRGTLLDAGDVRRTWERYLADLGANLGGLADRVAPLLEDGQTMAERIQIIRGAVNQVRREMVARAQEAPDEP